MIILSKLKKLLCTAFMAAVAATTGTTSTHATLTANESDLFLCFRATSGLGATSDYIVNIGPASQFTGAAGTINVDVGANILTDLENLFGADWKTRTDVVWSISGVQKSEGNGMPANTMFASRAEPAPGTQSTPWESPGAFAAGTPALKMTSMRDSFATGTITGKQTESGTKALIQEVIAPNSYASFMPGGTNTTGLSAFSYFSAAGAIENNFANGTQFSVIDLYRLIPDSGNGTLVGAFRLSDSAQLTFSPNVSTFDGPSPVRFAFATNQVSEEVASGVLAVAITRIGNADSAFTVNFSTADGTAVAGTDYVAHTNTPVSFAAGESNKLVNVSIISRAGFQGNRTFTATIAVATGDAQVISPSTATITIRESTPEPSTIALSAPSYTVAENAASGTVDVTVNRSGPTTAAVSASLSTTDGTAIAGTDYTAQSGATVSFAAGETTKVVQIAIANRAGFQGDRNFNVSLSAPSVNAVLGTPSSATITIQENEANPAGTIAFSNATYDLTTAGGTITLNRGPGTTGAVSVDIAASAGGTLTAGEDYTLTPSTVAFAEGATTATVNVQFTAAAAPLPGSFSLQLSNPQGGVSIGSPSVATVNVASTQVTIVAGNYTGLIVPTDAAPPAGALNNAFGLISIKVLSSGNFTGKALIGGATLPFTGKFNPDGTPSFKPSSSPTITLASKGKAPVTFGTLAMTFGGESISGSIGESATFLAERAAFDGQGIGKYTSILPAKVQDLLTSDQFPQGFGIGNISISKQGKFTFKGRLADGTPVSMSGALTAAKQVPLYAALYVKKGAIGGVVTLDDAPADSDLSGEDFLWIRPAQSTAKHYTAGWPSGVFVDLLGASYVTSKTASVIPNLGAEDPATGNADLEFFEGNLDASITQAVNVSVKNKVAIVPGNKAFKVTISAPTGAISGFFPDNDSVKTSFKGIVYQKGEDAGAFGYFLTTVPKGGPAGEAGGVTLIAK